MSAYLLKWRSAEPARQAVADRLRSQLRPVCGKLPANDLQRATCEGLLPG